MPRPGAVPTLVLAAGLACSGAPEPAVPLPSQPVVPPGVHRLEDRVVAVVDEGAILLSDLDQVIGLGLVEPTPGESLGALRARVLEGLIDQRLRFQQVDRFGLERVSVDLVKAQVATLADQFPSRRAFEERLEELELEEEELDQLVARQLMVLSYVEDRLGARIFVSLDDIREYYEGELAPRLRAAAEPVPPLEDVREEIRGLLRGQRLNEEIDRWTRDLRREADVQVFLDEPVEDLPPVIDRLEQR
jgi:hypothetical protein